MSENNNFSIALLGTTANLLTLGLLAVRRDLNLVGLYPGSLPHPQESPQSLHEHETVALHSTLLLGCPIYNNASELIEQSDLLIVDSDIMSDNTIDMSRHNVICLSDAQLDGGAESWQKLEITELNANDINSDKTCQNVIYVKANSQTARDRFKHLWETLTAPISSANDAGILTWAQAQALVQALYAPQVNA